ncbi:MAG: hypothetical protein AAGC85_22840 [Bacteroidota bacterium]
MQYKYAPNQNYEDFASGRVLYHKSGLATFPVRLAIEIAGRCLQYVDKEKAVIYDPMCGEAYLLTVVGFFYGERIHKIYGSDINVEALAFASKNLGLLTAEGLNKREKELQELIRLYQKDSHKEALVSMDNLREKLHTPTRTQVFHQNVFQLAMNLDHTFKADIILTDLPYGNLVDWQGKKENGMEVFYDALSSKLSKNGVLAIISDKEQKFPHLGFQRKEKFIVGKRKVEILQLTKEAIHKERPL